MVNSLKQVMLVDDHPVVRHGLAMLIEQQNNLAVCAETGSASEAIAMIPRTKPDIILLDISLGDCNGISVIKEIRTRFGKIPILVLSMHDETLYAERVLRIGGNGYLMKEESPERVIEAIYRVLRGEIHLSERMTTRMIIPLLNPNGYPPDRSDNAQSPVNCLSDRELEVFELIGNGLKTRQIADNLHVSIKTIEAHRANIKQKLNLTNAIELLQSATWFVQGKNEETAATPLLQ